MIEKKYQDIVSHIDYLISELKHLKTKISLEDGIHFNVINGIDLFAIELWDTELLEPRVLSYYKRALSIDEAREEACKALNTLGIRAYKKQIYWNSELEWELLPENFRKLDQVYKIEERTLSESLREEVLRRINALYNM
jgi:hypothetical protein